MKSKAKFAAVLVLFLVINLFTNITIQKPIEALAETQIIPYSNRYTYNEIGEKYVAGDNGISVTMDSINIIDKGTYDTYEIIYTQANKTDIAITEGIITIAFHNKERYIPTSFLGDLMPGESKTRTIRVNIAKYDTPWMVVYSKDIFSVDYKNLLKWDITPYELKGKSSNANLKIVETDQGNSLSSIKVSEAVEYITLNPVAEDENAQVIGGGTFSLNMGENIFDIKVISEMGIEKDYIFKVVRQSSNANLSQLSFSDGTLTPEFNKDITEYTLKLTQNRFILRTNAYAEDYRAKVEYDYNTYIREPITKSIKVKAEDGTTKEYTVNIVPPSSDASLKQVILNDGDYIVDVKDYNYI